MRAMVICLSAAWLLWAVGSASAQQAPAAPLPQPPDQVVPAGEQAMNAPDVSAKKWDDLAKVLKSKGYSIAFDQPDQRMVKVIFSKKEETAGKGLLGIPWMKQISGEATYAWTGSQWALADVEAKAEEKPPLLGDWAAVEDKDAVLVASTFRNQFQTVNHK
jgi:hypothetical protein